MTGVLKALTAPGVWTPVGTGGITQGDADARYLTQTDADARYVNVAGDTMTGLLSIAASSGHSIRMHSGGTQAIMDALKADGATRIGYLNFLENGDVRIAVDAGRMYLRHSSIDVLSIESASVTRFAAGVSLAFGAGAGHGYLYGWDGGSQFQMVATNNLGLHANGAALIINVAAAEQARFVSGAFLVGYTASNYATEAGASLYATGQTFATVANAGYANAYWYHLGGADASGQVYASFRRTGGVIIGSITQNGTTGVLFNVGSDRRLKTWRADADADVALRVVNAIDLVEFSWNDSPDDVHVGTFAQDMHEVAPWAVTVGQGEPGDAEFSPWGVDYSALGPQIIGAIQALTRRIEQLEAA